MIVGLMQKIEEMLDAPASSDEAPTLERMEETLTDGYAQALALEAERSRIERRIGEVASTADERSGLAEELTALAGQMRTADRDLRKLPAALRPLQARTRAA